MTEFKRHFIRKRELKEILTRFSKKMKTPLDVLSLNLRKIEIIHISGIQVISIDEKPKIVKVNGEFYPTLLFSEIFPYMAKVVVDMGAVPYICNGADVMAPGIVEVDGEFMKGDIVLVIDERNRMPISIGKALTDSEEARKADKGKVIKNLHYVGDSIWKLMKKL